MRPYKTFEKLGRVNALAATLEKKNGTSISLSVKPENFDAQTLEGQYANAVGVRIWSANVVDFYVDDVANFPDGGDLLIVTLDDGSVKYYSITRSVETARFWDYFFSRPGYRLKFYTKYEGFEVSPPDNNNQNEGVNTP